MEVFWYSGSMKIKVAAIILVNGDKALLQLRDNKPDIPHPNTWGFAGGGKLDNNESFKDGAIRELLEETGYKSKEPIEFMRTTYRLENGSQVEAVRLLEKYDQLQELECKEGQRIEFFTAEGIKRIDCFPGVAEAATLAIERSQQLD